MIGDAASAWDTEYARGRYRDEPPVGFVRDILAAARDQRLQSGVYIGCGNGRNLLPMLDAGLDLTGLDISAEAIDQLRRRRPDRAGKLIVGDLTALPATAHELVIGIQVFQHGTREHAHRHLLAAAERVAAGGLLCVRVNATDTAVEYDHDRTEEEAPDGGYTVRYRAGPKAGLDIHFFTAAELSTLVADRFTELLAPRLHTTHRTPPGRGQWSQWEAIWQRRPRSG